jgi:hypothetical protein
VTRAKLEFTRFLQERLSERLEPILLRAGYTPPQTEKNYQVEHKWQRVAFDLWCQKREHHGRFLIWEIEVRQLWAHNNVKKIEEILGWRWKPTVSMYHIFSPMLAWTKERCMDEGRKLKRRFPRQLSYTQLDLAVSEDRLERVINAFESNKYSAKQYYDDEVLKLVRRIVRQSSF